MSHWRVGRKLGRTLYVDERVIGMVDTAEMARAIVDAMNGIDIPEELSGLRAELKGAINDRNGWIEKYGEASAALRIALEAWEWLSETHVALGEGHRYTAVERVEKAQTCLSTAVEWEEKHPAGAKRFASGELELTIEKLTIERDALKAKLEGLGERSTERTCCDPRFIKRDENDQPIGWTITLNEYQRSNLLWLLCDVAGYDRPTTLVSGLNTGDWAGEIPNALLINERGEYEESKCPPNPPGTIATKGEAGKIETAELRGRIAGMRWALDVSASSVHRESDRLEAELKKLGGEAEVGRCCPLCKRGLVMDDVPGKRCSLRYSLHYRCLWDSSMVIDAYRDPK